MNEIDAVLRAVSRALADEQYQDRITEPERQILEGLPPKKGHGSGEATPDQVAAAVQLVLRLNLDLESDLESDWWREPGLISQARRAAVEAEMDSFFSSLDKWLRERKAQASVEIDTNPTLQEAALDRQSGWMTRLLKIRDVEWTKPRLGQTWNPLKTALHGAYWHAVESGAQLERALDSLEIPNQFRHQSDLIQEIEDMKTQAAALVAWLHDHVTEDL